MIDMDLAKQKYEAYLFSRLFIDIEDMIETRDMTFEEFLKHLKKKEAIING